MYRKLPNHAISDLLEIVEIDDAESFAGDLFKRLFNASIPDFPRHYIATYLADTTMVAGYVHFTKAAEIYLCGGLCIDARLYRQMPATLRTRVGSDGGIAEVMLRECFSDLNDRDAIFGYCGDLKSMKVCLRAGFLPTQHPFLIVHWKKTLTVDRKNQLIAKAHAVGLF